MKALVDGTTHKDYFDTISYEQPGRIILAQGSEIVHHVTPVLSKEKR
jgi:hypothetical protein